PAQSLRRAAELVGGVDRADDDDSRRRAEHLGKDALSVQLEHAARTWRDLTGLDHAPLAGPLAPEDGQRDRGHGRIGQLALEALNEDVDLAAAGQSDRPRLVVADPVGQEAGPAVL